MGDVRSDADEGTKDFIGLTSNMPIYRMEYESLGGLALAGDDLLTTMVNVAMASAGGATTTIPVGTTQTTAGVTAPAGPSGTSHSSGTPGPSPAPAATTTTATTPAPAYAWHRYEETDSRLKWSCPWFSSSLAEGISGYTFMQVGSAASVKLFFDGTQIKVYGAGIGAQAGIGRFVLDYDEPGEQEFDADFWWGGGSTPVWTRPVLAPGPHRLMIQWTGRMNSGSFAADITVDCVEVHGTLSN